MKCLHCKKEISSEKRGDSKFCSPVCRNNAWRLINRPKNNAYKEEISVKKGKVEVLH